MSWGASGTASDGEVSLAVDRELTKEEMSQLSAASHAVQAIVKTGALGDPLASYHVSVTGHANKEHEPVAGWSNDSLSIHISQATKEAQ